MKQKISLKKLLFLFSVFVIIFSCLIFLYQNFSYITLAESTTVEVTTNSNTESPADTTNSNQLFTATALSTQEITEGMAEIPKGAITIDGLFATPNYSGNGGATVETVTSPSDNNGIPYSVISLSGNQNFTSIWSNDSYKLDFDNSFEGRTYVNFGSSAETADGFAFVMHNDSNGTNALTTATNASADGQNLGVYGSTDAYREIEGWSLVTRTPDYRAIKNSVAVEFDLNYNAGDNIAYDFQVDSSSIPHMAYTFPGVSSSYTPDGNGWLDFWGNGRRVAINHNGLISLNGTVGTNVRDETWYEFRYSFDATTQIFSYYLENPSNGNRTAVTTIPWSDLATQLNLSANDNKAYWGFTAANGAATGKTQFVFTQPPVALQATVVSDIKNAAGNSIATANNSTAAGEKNVEAGETVTISSDFTLTGESPMTINSWATNLSADAQALNLSGASAITNVIANTNGTQIAGTAVVDAENGSVNLTFPNLIVQPNTSVTFSYQVQTQKSQASSATLITVDTTVLGTETINGVPSTTQSTFQGEEKYFWVINGDEPTELSWQETTLQTELSISHDISDVAEGLVQDFYWQDSDTSDTLEFRLFKNGTVVATTRIVTDGSQDFQKISITIPAEDLTYGTNEFTIVAFRLNNYSNAYEQQEASLNLTVSLSGQLSLVEAPDILSWTQRTVATSKGELPRDAGNELKLSVLDSREGSHNWTVNATVSGDAGNLFTLVWKNSASDSSTGLSSQAVMSNATAEKSGYMYTESWSADSGVLLQSDNYLSVGDYSGQLQVLWQLSDVASAE